MVHFAVIAPPFASHVRALEALAQALLDRGHRVTWVHQADVRGVLRSPRIEFCAVGATTHPPGTLVAMVARAARPGGPLGLRRVIRDMVGATDMLCREAPAVLARRGVQAVLADSMEAAGALVAGRLGLPFVSIACALPVNREARVPLPVMHWGPADSEPAQRINEGSTRIYDWIMRPHARVVARHARAFGLAPRERLDQCLSPLLQLSQTVRGFDFARDALPAHFHHVGPLRAPPGAEAPLAACTPGLDAARPFIFASLGTLQGGRLALFKRIARACRALDAQLLVAHCDALGARDEAVLRRAGATWVTGFAPQRAAVARADVVVTHGGLNTVMDALAAGTPMLVLPLAFDQPGCAARVLHGGTGLRLQPALASDRAVRQALARLLGEPAFRTAAQALAPEVQAAGGTSAAADRIEGVFRRGPRGDAGHPGAESAPDPLALAGAVAA